MRCRGIHAATRSPGRRGRTGWNGNRTASGPTTSTHFTRARRAAIAILDAILAEDLPDAQQIRATLAFGRGAQVLMDGDVVFLSVFGDNWLITAAGCTARGDRPYDCTVMGG